MPLLDTPVCGSSGATRGISKNFCFFPEKTSKRARPAREMSAAAANFEAFDALLLRYRRNFP
jgi:hypothetical protein